MLIKGFCANIEGMVVVRIRRLIGLVFPVVVVVATVRLDVHFFR